jgi:hypothetical protein
MSPTARLDESKPITHEPMRSISRRAGCSTVAKKSGSETGDAQHRHLQAREPDAHRRRDRVFHQDALEQQRDDLDRRPLDRRGRGLLEGLLPLVQLLEQRRRVDGRATAGIGAGRAGEAARDALLRLDDRCVQARRRRRRRVRGHREIGQLAADEAVEPAEHRLGLVVASRQAGRARHQARFLADFADRARPRRRRLEFRRSLGDMPVGVPKPPPEPIGGSRPPWFERRMNGRRSTSGRTWRCSRKRLVSWYASSANSDSSSCTTDWSRRQASKPSGAPATSW